MEARIKVVEEKLWDAVQAAKSINLSLEELSQMLKIFYEETL